jgi:hypothetical protein
MTIIIYNRIIESPFSQKGISSDNIKSENLVNRQMTRYSNSQIGRTLLHPILPQPDGDNDNETGINKLKPKHSFVVCSDTQIGMMSGNKEWETELEYSRQAIQVINELQPRPLFCCMCGDLVDMEHTFFAGQGFTKEECDSIQDLQNMDFKNTWSALHEDIALVCICGNHGMSDTFGVL